MENKPISLNVLRSFTPLDGLKKENLQALATKAALRELPSDRTLFKEGENDKRTVFLVSGMVELLQNGNTVAVVRAGTPEARNPIAPMMPRRYTAVVASAKAEFIVIDSDLLDVMLTWDQTGSYQVNELGGQTQQSSDDWMTTLLQNKSFHKIPPANLQAIFMRLERIDCRAGQRIISQGDDGDFFYIIVKGTCQVTRETPLNKDGVKLADLTVGDTFGEEALIADAKRNANVTMMTDGVLMRLGKEDFKQLLNEPLLEYVDQYEAARMTAKGAKWLDVRLPSEFEVHHLDDAINIPLYFLRIKMKTLDNSATYIVYCDTGRRSAAAAYIMAERGFHAHVLQGGMQGMLTLAK
jgi:CRP-like cAMP-binding protein